MNGLDQNQIPDNKREKIDALKKSIQHIIDEVKNHPYEHIEFTGDDIQFVKLEPKEIVAQFHELTISIAEDLLAFIDRLVEDIDEKTLADLIKTRIGSVTIDFYNHESVELAFKQAGTLQNNMDIKAQAMDICIRALDSDTFKRYIEIEDLDLESFMRISHGLYFVSTEEKVAAWKQLCSEAGIRDPDSQTDILNKIGDYFGGIKNIVASATDATAEDLHANVIASFAMFYKLLTYFVTRL